MTGKEQLEQRDALLDEYEKNIGVSKFQAPGEPEELEVYLNMDRQVMEGMSSEECGYIGARLAQFAFHIQRAQNRELARVSWAKNEIKMCIATELDSVNGYGYEEKYYKCVKANDHARKLNQIMIYAQQRADRLNFVSNGLKTLGDAIKSIKFAKIGVKE